MAAGLPSQRRRRRAAVAAVLAAAALLAAGCGDGRGEPRGISGATPTAADTPAGSASPAPAVQRHPDIVAVDLRPAGDGVYDVSVTVSSPYDSPERYADGWRVLAPDGTELATHLLAHDHAGEQPFTRTQTGVEIPATVDEVTVEGRDQRFGYGGATVTVDVPHDGG